MPFLLSPSCRSLTLFSAPSGIPCTYILPKSCNNWTLGVTPRKHSMFAQVVCLFQSIFVSRDNTAVLSCVRVQWQFFSCFSILLSVCACVSVRATSVYRCIPMVKALPCCVRLDVTPFAPSKPFFLLFSTLSASVWFPRHKVMRGACVWAGHVGELWYKIYIDIRYLYIIYTLNIA